MIRAHAKSSKGDVILLGISKANVERLMNGEPIRVTGQSVGTPSVLSITIFYGETEAIMEAELRKMGVIGEHTTVVVDAKLADIMSKGERRS